MKRTIGAVALVLGFVGCGSSSDGSGGGTMLAIEQFPDAFASAICDNIAGCCDAASLPYDAAGCRARMDQALASLTAAASLPNVTWNASAAGACVEQAAAVATQCGDLMSVTICNQLGNGILSPGDACSADHECRVPSGGNARCYQGVCVQEPRGKLGDPCAELCIQQGPTTICELNAEPGLAHCNEEDGLYCTYSGACEPLPKVGESCPQGYCASGAYCESGACAPKKAHGESCAWHAECNGLCISGVCGPLLAGFCS